MSLYQIGGLQIGRVEEVTEPNVRAWEFFPDLPTDTCTGNHEEHPAIPPLHRLDTPWLQRLSLQRIHPEQVDYVTCTHLHADHVGWTTRLVDNRWGPTFPNAKHFFAQHEFNHWDPAGQASSGYGQDGVFEDSILPCVEAPLVTLVDDGFDLDDSFWIEAAPGHTRGNALIRARSRGATGLFTDDCMHTPLQIVYPDMNSAACEDAVEARATRRRVLSECADSGHLLIPAHFTAPYVGGISRSGESFRYAPGP